MKKKHKDDALAAMNAVVGKAAYTFGGDWKDFLDTTTYVFTGYYGHGASTMLMARQYGVVGLIGGDTGFHTDFQDPDTSQQVRHFWAGFATAANPLGDNAAGAEVARWGNNWHEINQDTVRGDDGATVKDYALTLTAIDIAGQVGNQIQTPADLAQILLDRIGKDGSGYTGPAIDPNLWWPPTISRTRDNYETKQLNNHKHNSCNSHSDLFDLVSEQGITSR